MSEKIMKKSRVLIAALLGTVMIAALTLWGCSGSGYDDPATLVTTTQTPAVINAQTLKDWINEGKLNAPFGSKDRVVIVSAAILTDWLSKGHIADAVRWDTSKLAEDGRTEGLGTTSGLTPSGTMMDAVIQELGIDGNTTVVITMPKNSGTGGLYSQALVYWDLRYWGFSRDRIKILNGGDDGWEELAGNAVVYDSQDKYKKSTYSVAYNTGLKTAVRYSIGQMIAKVDEMADPAVQAEWQMIDVRGASNNYMNNALRLTNAQHFLISAANKNYKYPSKDDLTKVGGDFEVKTVYAQGQVAANTPSATVSGAKKTIVMCMGSTSAAPSFVMFDAVLGAPEGSIAMYDGSYSQWSYYNNALLAAKYTTATPAQIAAWSFSNRFTQAATTGLPAALPASGFSWNAPSLLLGPNAPGMSDQIEKGDRAYIEFIRLNKPADTNSGTGGSQQGC